MDQLLETGISESQLHYARQISEGLGIFDHCSSLREAV